MLDEKRCRVGREDKTDTRDLVSSFLCIGGYPCRSVASWQALVACAKVIRNEFCSHSNCGLLAAKLDAAWDAHCVSVFSLWLGYILVVDGLVLRQSGTSLLHRSPRHFALLFLASAPTWWIFVRLEE